MRKTKVKQIRKATSGFLPMVHQLNKWTSQRVNHTRNAKKFLKHGDVKQAVRDAENYATFQGGRGAYKIRTLKK